MRQNIKKYHQPTVNSWRSMRGRCCFKNPSHYKWYQARGIKVCDRWMKFENFLADMGERQKGMMIDRIDNNKGYSSENCRWADYETQQNNRRSNHLVTFNGKTQSIAKWAKESGLKYFCLYFRLTRLGWSIEKALTT